MVLSQHGKAWGAATQLCRDRGGRRVCGPEKAPVQRRHQLIPRTACVRRYRSQTYISQLPCIYVTHPLSLSPAHHHMITGGGRLLLCKSGSRVSLRLRCIDSGDCTPADHPSITTIQAYDILNNPLHTNTAATHIHPRSESRSRLMRPSLALCPLVPGVGTPP